MLISPENLAALADLPGRWIDAIHDRRPPKVVTPQRECDVIERRLGDGLRVDRVVTGACRNADRLGQRAEAVMRLGLWSGSFDMPCNWRARETAH